MKRFCKLISAALAAAALLLSTMPLAFAASQPDYAKIAREDGKLIYASIPVTAAPKTELLPPMMA